MKIRKKLPFSVAAAMLFSAVSFAQTASLSASGKAEPRWKPANIPQDGKHSIEKVDFYTKPAECNEKKFLLVKVINTNAFPVSVEWKDNNGMVKTVVPASSTVEGSCANNLIVDRELFQNDNTFKESLLSSLEVRRMER